MTILDWAVLSTTLLSIIVYGIYKSYGQKNLEGYFLGNRSLPWYHVMFSVITTQASAITFISAPGQAYHDGMRFLQFYLGMPIAIIVVSAVFMPRFRNLNIYTAYQYLESRFDVRTRALTALLFLIQRGMAAGLTIYAPAIILSTLLGWNIYLTNLIMGSLVIVYTVAGGTKAVSYTQLQQMFVISAGMFIAGFMIVHLMPAEIGFMDAMHISGKLGHLNAITTDFNLNDKYNVWSGLIGGFFLALSYFGTDQSQVGRYLSGKSLDASRRGMLLTGAVKIPMQFLILMIGALLVAFYHFYPTPLFHNEVLLNQSKSGKYASTFEKLETAQQNIHITKSQAALQLTEAMKTGDAGMEHQATEKLLLAKEAELNLRKQTITLLKASGTSETNDTNYVFLQFVLKYLPAGLIGLLIAVIFSASWSSTASELNALSSTSVMDLYKRLIHTGGSEIHYMNASKLLTVVWGIIAIGVSMFAHTLGSMIEAVNILGSLFYGTILGIFITAFFLKYISGTAAFYSVILAEIIILIIYFFDGMAFLWLNALGCGLVMLISTLLELGLRLKNKKAVI
jgi:solute:Na+ symporter, SSS family